MRDALTKDQDYMNRALALAARARGRTAPNPMVGCVIVKDGVVVGEGFHEGPGLAHAEVNAILNAGDNARSATAYVTLEPCNHTGRTGPCAEALIEAGVSTVIYAMDDPNPTAAGGAMRLREAGIAVRSGVCEDAARALNHAWLHSLRFGRPYVVAKSAMSLDGRIATASGESKWITGEGARAIGHKIRAGADAIIAGAETIIADDPSLTARTGDTIHAPLRVVLDSTGRSSPGAKAFERSGKGAILATTDAAPQERLRAFREMGVEIVTLSADANGRVDPLNLLEALHERGALTVMIEGGGAVIGSFFDADLIDEVALFVAPKLIGGGRPAFGGVGVGALGDAGRFLFDAPQPAGPDLYYRGVRKREAA